MQIWQLIVAGVIVHVVLFFSIFDIYFTTPLVHGMTPVKSPVEPPAKRLFLFVTDGLRADKFFKREEGMYRAPYLRQIIEKEGVWGVSHTRVPTETRPGHVALIAGFYEDVSAVTKGWKENPVEFDSVFNETRHTWSWGSPDVLPMFAKGASGQHVHVNCYSAGFEDFARRDKIKLDTWVFDHVTSFFTSFASSNETLKQQLQSDGVVFFLHLLGLDTNGHSNKPHSRQYLNNIQVVDDGIKKIVNLVNKFYNNDGKSAFIVTSDHGMTDWGSHGAGEDDETMTPFVAWGAGIRHPIVGEHCGIQTDNLCAEWNLETIKRTDMEQADVAPLMTTLIGVPFPLNSVGRLPIDVLNGSTRDQAEMLFANALQILAQYDVKRTQVKERTISATFRDFPELRELEKLQVVMRIRQLIQNGQYSVSISETEVLIKKALNGLRYFQTYDRFFLGACVILGFTGWMAYIMSILTFEHTAIGKGVYRDPRTATFLTQGFGLVAALVVVLLYVQGLPLMCYFYCLLPVFLWYKSAPWLRIVSKFLYGLYVKGQLMEVVWSVLVCVAGLEIAIFSFYYRELLSFGLIALAVRPLIKLRITCDRRCDLMSTDLGWIVSCLLTAVFPLMPVIGRDKHYSWVGCSGVLAIILSLVMYSKVAFTSNKNVKLLFLLQLMLVVLSIIIVVVATDSIQDSNGLPLPCQIGSWTILALSFILPLLTPTTLGDRLFSLTLAFLALYLLLSIAHEVFFFLSLSSLLYFWLKTEADGEQHTFHKIIAYSIPLQNVEQIDFLHQEDSKDNLSRSSSSSKNMELEDLHTAFIFIFLIVIAFFGTGNIASINSFDPASVLCFLTVFSPFRMGALLMLKIAIPFLLVTCFLRGIVVVTQTSLKSLTLIVLIMSDFMGLHFFFLVRDYGSWLEIGTAISHYVIVMTMIIFILLLLGVSYALTSWGRVRFNTFVSRICKSRQWST